MPNIKCTAWASKTVRDKTTILSTKNFWLIFELFKENEFCQYWFYIFFSRLVLSESTEMKQLSHTCSSLFNGNDVIIAWLFVFEKPSTSSFK